MVSTNERRASVSAAADDLDDGLDYNIDFASGSDNEQETIAGDQEKLAPEIAQNEDASSSQDTKSQIDNPKKRKAKESLKQKKKIKMEMDMQRKKNLSLETSPEAIADWVNSKIRSKNPDLSALELSELYLNKDVFRATGDFKEARTLDNLSVFITNKFKNMLVSEKGKNKSKKNKNKDKDNNQQVDEITQSRKFICILSMSALRACDVHRATKELGGSSLKLINKNKLDVDLKLIKSTRSRVLCCTPGRLEKVLDAENSGLKRDEIKIIILDNSYLDQKMQNIWDIAETLTTLQGLTKTGSKIYLY